MTTQELAEGVTAEYDEESRLVSMESLDGAKRFGDPDALQ